jgi:flagellar hook protein FlgE
VTFQDILSQTVRGASGPQGGRGGVNPAQVGLGVLISGVDTIQTQGTLQSTGKLTDMAIQGDGYFVMSDGNQQYFSRDGAFDLGIDGTLVNPASGLHVLGWQADPATGLVDTTVPAGNITVPIGAGMTGKESTILDVAGNLDSNATTVAPGNTVDLSTTVYDSQGNPQQVTLTFSKTASNNWSVTAASTAAAVTGVTFTGGTTLTFNADGKVDTTIVGNGSMQMNVALDPVTTGATSPLVVNLDLSTVTQLAALSDMNSNTDGASAGSLTTFTVGAAGDITGIYSNGYKQALGQIALASFANPSGLMKAGGNLFTASPNSGTANIGVPDSNGRGQIATGFLEGSNVDLAQQFTNMIMAERGFQANSRVITTSDEILQDLVNIKR